MAQTDIVKVCSRQHANALLSKVENTNVIRNMSCLVVASQLVLKNVPSSCNLKNGLGKNKAKEETTILLK